MSEWFETLPGLYDEVWNQLAQGAARKDVAAQQPTLSTISPDGWPESRTVVLRSADRSRSRLDAFTDVKSDKMASLASHPRAALHFWDAERALQVRIQATVAVCTGSSVADDWHALPDAARLSYGITPPPGQALSDALDYVKTPDQSRFCVLQLTVVHIDAVHLGKDHRRAIFTAANGWTGMWVSP
ncbi:pyridoxamine 5'-phosphate oxidase family protein [Loktanella salsilacus]|uniref:pyridoxamine 5'-phosphate oxidase family protein n=1 Tax=Loktanella salsilacus TaxID=195913 RepID=UPI00373551C9